MYNSFKSLTPELDQEINFENDIHIRYWWRIFITSSNIHETSIKCMFGTYGVSVKETSLDEYRYLSLIKSEGKNKLVKINLLSTTANAIELHLDHVYY